MLIAAPVEFLARRQELSHRVNPALLCRSATERPPAAASDGWSTPPRSDLFDAPDRSFMIVVALAPKASRNPIVAANRNSVHKIGVTNLDVEKRVAGARLQPTFLMADVEIVATYELYNINRTKLKNLIHRIFAPARLDIEIRDRFGNPVVPREWFLVPLDAIDSAVEE